MFLIITFCTITIIQILYYLFFYLKFSGKTYNSENKSNLPVSIIICVKNEAKNLVVNLPFFAEQNYFSFEIILVDDFSTDNSLEIMLQFQRDFTSKNISIIVISPDKNILKGKKNALSTGIKKAKHEYILLTDADCKPNSSNWIREMISQFSEEKTIVLGYGAYQKNENSYLNKIIRFETLMTALQYFSYANIGKAYMGVGRNIAYKKNEFFKAFGFENHRHIISGDDDLFISEIATSKNIATCIIPTSFTTSEPKNNFKDWINQKRRHITTANHYKPWQQFSLGIFYFSQISFWILAITLILLLIHPIATIFLVFLRLMIWYLAIHKSAKQLQEKDLTRYALLYEFSLIFIQLYIFIRNLISPPNQW